MIARVGLKSGAEIMSKNDPSDEGEKAITARVRQRAIGRELRGMYDDIVQEPIPDEFMDLLKKIDETSGKKDEAQ